MVTWRLLENVITSSEGWKWVYYWSISENKFKWRIYQFVLQRLFTTIYKHAIPYLHFPAHNLQLCGCGCIIEVFQRINSNEGFTNLCFSIPALLVPNTLYSLMFIYPILPHLTFLWKPTKMYWTCAVAFLSACYCNKRRYLYILNWKWNSRANKIRIYKNYPTLF